MGLGSYTTRTAHIIALATATALLVATPAFAAPSALTTATVGSDIVATTPETEAFRAQLVQKQQLIDDFMAQLDALDQELEVASEQYNAATDQLAQMKQQVAVAESDLTNARSAYDTQSDLLGQRADSIYREGTLSGIEILLDSKSVSDFMSRVKFLNTLGMNDADIAASLNGQKLLLEQQVADLKNSETAAQSLEFELKARQIEVMARIQERQSMVDQAKVELREFLEVEAARRRSEQSSILTQVLSGGDQRGIVATPGSPVETALAYHGIPYLWGGETPSGFDCSGLMLYVFRQHGVTLPHYSGSQFRMGEKVAKSDLQPGDAVFFGSPIHHVGMYIGGGYFLHAPKTGDFVKISKLADRSDFAGARRYPWQPRVDAPQGVTSAAL